MKKILFCLFLSNLLNAMDLVQYNIYELPMNQNKISNKFIKMFVLKAEWVPNSPNPIASLCIKILYKKQKPYDGCSVMVQKNILSIEEKFLPEAGENQTPAPLKNEELLFVQKTTEIVPTTEILYIDDFQDQHPYDSSIYCNNLLAKVFTLPECEKCTTFFAVDILKRHWKYFEKNDFQKMERIKDKLAHFEKIKD